MTNESKKEDLKFMRDFNKLKSDVAKIKKALGIDDNLPNELPKLPHDNTPKSLRDRKQSF